MKQRFAIPFYSVLGILLTAGPAFAQDNFGASVAVVEDQVLVVKPGQGRGQAAMYVYEADGDEWREVQRLGTEITNTTGERLGPQVVVDGNIAYVGSADPDVRWAAHAYERQEDGTWRAIDPVPMDPTASGEAADRGPLDRDGLYAILAPPQRTVSVLGDRVAVAAVSGSGAGTVRLLERDEASGQWRTLSEIVPEGADTSGEFGRALLLTEDVLFVGAPRQGEGAGMVYVFEAGDEGWVETNRLDGAGLADVRRLGAAIEMHDDMLILGAPGAGDDAGAAVMFRRTDDGRWEEVDRLAQPGEPEARSGDRFGTAIESGRINLWIGAPSAPDGGANVVAFDTRLGGYPAKASFDGEGGMGASIAAAGDIVAFGAPLAGGGVGRVTTVSLNSLEMSPIEPAGALESITGGEVRCTDGEAAGFSCTDVDLLSFLTVEALGGSAGESVSDIWGWTDPETGFEYGLVGWTGGVTIVSLADPANPLVVGTIPANRSGARDIKTYANHAFFTGDGAGEHGLVVFDLTRLRDVTDTPATFEPDAVYREMASAHNLAINEESGFAYVVRSSRGGETCGGGLHMVDIRSPKEPKFAGCYTDTEGLLAVGSGHDTQCVVYRGPDADYQGRELCFASNETALRVVDVTDKANPVPITAISFPGQAYIHQGWLTEDHAYFFMDDELDEIVGNTERTRTLIWDLEDLDDPTYAGDHLGPDAATDHNLYIRGDRMYQANYQGGMRVVDISDRTDPEDVGGFDTTPYDANPPGFGGAWTAYPFFESGTVIVSSIREGLFVLRPVRPLVP